MSSRNRTDPAGEVAMRDLARSEARRQHVPDLISYEVRPHAVATSSMSHEALRQHIDRAWDEIERLRANVDRLTSNPADHRYWEGRYRDEAAENEKLRAVDDALKAWVEMQSGPNTARLYNAALRRFNINPVIPD